jgi:hypothetical protein
MSYSFGRAGSTAFHVKPYYAIKNIAILSPTNALTDSGACMIP